LRVQQIEHNFVSCFNIQGLTVIFSSLPRDDDAPKRERETSFEFLDRSSRPEIARVRDFVGDALAHYPLNEVDELAARIRSRDERAFRSATFELLLHEGLRRLGYSLQPHPTMPNGAPARPDFLVTDHGGNSFYLEAVLASSRDGTNQAAEAIKATALDALSQAPHYNFRVTVDSEGDPTTQPRSRELIRQVHEWLSALNPDDLSVLIADRGFEAAPQLSWQHEAWTLTFQPIPIRPDRRGTARTLLGTYGAEMRRIDDWTPLRNAVKTKGRKYGDLDRPLLVAVNADSFNLDPIDEMQALFGQEEYVVYVGRPDIGDRLRRIPNGAWAGPHGPQARRVSGAWFFNDLTIYTAGSRRSTLYVNPWAHLELPPPMLRFPHARLVDDRIVQSGELTFREVFGLYEGWPV
jgi:hypothetical protein